MTARFQELLDLDLCCLHHLQSQVTEGAGRRQFLADNRHRPVGSVAACPSDGLEVVAPHVHLGEHQGVGVVFVDSDVDGEFLMHEAPPSPTESSRDRRSGVGPSTVEPPDRSEKR